MRRRDFFALLAGTVAGAEAARSIFNRKPEKGSKSPVEIEQSNSAIYANPEWKTLPPGEQMHLWEESAKSLINQRDFAEFKQNPYLIACLMYSSNFLEKIKKEKNEDSTRELVAKIHTRISPKARREYVEFLNQELAGYKYDEKRTPPLQKINFGKGVNHSDAVDLFIEEGSPVFSITSGYVCTAESGWVPENPMSTSSLKGGNTVVIYSAIDGSFYRYCHLNNVDVVPGQKIIAGYVIGSVGHTGKNAYKPGHGNHLHFEKNSISQDGSLSVAARAQELRKELIGIVNA